MNSYKSGSLQISKALGAAMTLATLSSLYVLFPESPIYQQSDFETQWTQPKPLDSIYKTPINANSWLFDFDEVKKTLKKITRDDGALSITPALAEKLEIIVSGLPENMDASNLSRLRHLIALHLPADTGEHVGELIERFYHYTRSKEQLAEENETLSAEARHARLLALQNEHLGPDLAQKLYERQNSLAEFLFASRKVQSDQSLSDEQRQQRLDELRLNYREQLKPDNHREND